MWGERAIKTKPAGNTRGALPKSARAKGLASSTILFRSRCCQRLRPILCKQKPHQTHHALDGGLPESPAAAAQTGRGKPVLQARAHLPLDRLEALLAMQRQVARNQEARRANGGWRKKQLQWVASTSAPNRRPRASSKLGATFLNRARAAIYGGGRLLRVLRFVASFE